MDYTPLKYVYKSSGNPEAYTLLLLHGTGGDENDLIPLAEDFNLGFNILSVRGNVSENGMPRFFKRLGMGIFDEKDLEFRTDELAAFLKEAATQQNFKLEKIIALGYSNGANIAGALLLKYPGLLAGAVLYRPMLPFKKFAAGTANSDAPVLFTSGQHDPTVKPADTNKYLELLRTIGFNVQDHALNASHGLINDDINLAREWFREHFTL